MYAVPACLHVIDALAEATKKYLKTGTQYCKKVFSEQNVLQHCAPCRMRPKLKVGQTLGVFSRSNKQPTQKNVLKRFPISIKKL
jgi:hypothetical protein